MYIADFVAFYLLPNGVSLTPNPNPNPNPSPSPNPNPNPNTNTNPNQVAPLQR